MAGLHIKRTALAVVVAGALAGGACAAQQEGPQSIVVTGQRSTSPWVRAESAHVVVVSDAPRADVARLVEHLERLDALLRAYTADYGATGAGPEPKLNLVYLDDSRLLARVDPEIPAKVIGMVGDCAGGAQGFLVHTEPLPAVEDERLAVAPLHEGLSYVSQAYARHFLYRHTDVRVPAGWVEGFSNYFAGVMFGTKQMVIGRTPPGLVRYFRFIDEGHRHWLDYNDVLGEDPFRHVPGASRMPASIVEFQARSWILAHYVLGAGERRQRLGTFLNAVHRDGNAVAALRDAFGVDAGAASALLWRYRLQQARALRVEMPWQAPPAVGFTTLSAAAGEFALADTVLKSCPARAQGERLLRTLSADAAAAPNVAAGQLALSRARVDWGDPAAAVPWLESAARQADASADVLYLLARANLKLAARADAGARAAYLDGARASLARAREREPGSGGIALAELELSLLADGAPSRAALDGVIAAWRTSRASGPLARAAALAWCYLVDAPRAEHVLRVLANDRRDPATAAWAVQFQRRLDAGLTLADIAAEMRKGPDDGAPPGRMRELTLDLDALTMDAIAEEKGAQAKAFLASRTLGVLPTTLQSTSTAPPGRPVP
jgi:hypothetical protein